VISEEINEILAVDFSSKIVSIGIVSEVISSILISVGVHVENFEDVRIDVAKDSWVVPDNGGLLVVVEIVRLQSTEFLRYCTELNQF